MNSEEHAGIVPRSVRAIFEQLESTGVEFTVRVSFLELYNEELKDLLAEDKTKQLRLCEDVKKGVVCQNLEEFSVLNTEAIFEIIQRGIKERATAATLCNKNSSRSHSIFTMKIMIKECNVEGEEVVRHGQLNLVDLAGSECVGRSGAKNDRAREAGSINQSLLTLGRVITALVDHHGHIPYRDSKLTRLLQESLGGKAKTCIIATLSPSQLSMEESLSTLDYAYRAKSIKNAPQANQKMTKKVVLKEYCQEIEHLRAQLQITRDKNGVYVDPVEYEMMEARIASQESQLNECESALKVKSEEVKTLRSERHEIEHKLDAAEKELDGVNSQLGVVRAELIDTQENLKEVTVELSATEAVVEEQVLTEEALSAEAMELQTELVTRRGDMDNLLGKVDRLVAMEKERVKAAENFSAELNMNCSSLLSIVTRVTDRNTSESSELCEGVAGMLTKGRDTCATLKDSIQGALSTLIGDATVAKDTMSSSCDGLKVHLQGTDRHVSDTLLGIQQQLSSWLSQVDKSMAEAQRELSAQREQLAGFTSTITEHAATFATVSEKFAASQKALSSKSSETASALRCELVDQLGKFNKAEEERAVSTAEALQTQANHMQSTMSTLIQNMLQASLAAVSASTASTQSFSESMTMTVNSGVDTIKASIESIDADVSSSYGELAKMSAHTSASHCENVASAVRGNEGADRMLAGVSGDVAHKKELLDSTVHNLISAVNSSITQGCEVVDSTAATADSILRDVTRATEAMRNSAYESIDSFTCFMDGQGQQLSTDLSNHFTALTDSLKKQTETLGEIEQQLDGYSTDARTTVVKPTGTTPRKVVFPELATLSSTREHEIIKMEAKALAGVTVDMLKSDGSRSRSVSHASASTTASNYSEIENGLELLNSIEETYIAVEVPERDNAVSEESGVVTGVSAATITKTSKAVKAASMSSANAKAVPTKLKRVRDREASCPASLSAAGVDAVIANGNGENADPRHLNEEKDPTAASGVQKPVLHRSKSLSMDPEGGVRSSKIARVVHPSK